MTDFHYQPLFELGADDTPYRQLTAEGVKTVAVDGRELLTVDADVLRLVARTAFDDISHLLRPAHLAQLRSILDDPEASHNDRFVALELLRNANIAAGRVLPGCQDTGTAIVIGHKGENVFTGGDDAVALSHGIYDAYDQRNLRYSQMAPLDMFTEKNTGSNLPAQIEIYTEPGNEYELLFIAKGGGSANKSYLYQETKALLNPASLLAFTEEKLRSIGTSACPPYHLALVIGGPSAEFTLKTVKLASTHYLDNLPRTGNEHGRAFREVELEQQIFEILPAHRYRGAVRRQVFRPRRPRHPVAAARRVLPGGAGCLLFGRPSSACQDHARGGFSRAARREPGAVSTGRHTRGPRWRCGVHRPAPADEGDPGPAEQVPGCDPVVAERADDRGPRHRAREAEGSA